MANLATYVTRLARGARRGWIGSFSSPGPIGETSACPEGEVLDHRTGLLVCLGDLVIDPETGDLVTPAEAAERRQQRGGGGAEVLVWDGTTEEWITVEESNRRRANRQKLRREAQAVQERAGIQRNGEDDEPGEPATTDDDEPGSALIFPQVVGVDRFDVLGGEWVTDEELSVRDRERRRLAEMLVGTTLGGRRLPNLGAIAGRKVEINEDGIAVIGDKPASEALVEDVTDDETNLIDLLKEALTGAQKRAAKEKTQKRLVLLAALVAIVAAILLRRRQGS